MPLDPALPPRQTRAPSRGLPHIATGGLQVMLLAVIAGVLGIGALDLASGIAVPTVLAILAAIALAPLARRIESIGIPASLAAAVIVAGIVFSTAFAIYALLPSAEAWNARAPHVIRDIEQRVRDINISITDAISITPEAAPVPSPPQTDGQSPPPDADAENPAAGDALGRLVDGGQKMAADWAISAPGIVAAAVYWAVLTFFMLRDRGMLGRRVMALGGRVSSMRALGRAIQDVQNDVASYLLAITLINIALGCGVAAAFYLFGMPNAALWGVAATLLNFMPFIGAAIMAIVTLSVGLVSFADPINAFFLLGVVVILNSIEAQIATPMIVGARIRLPAIGIFVAIAFGAWLWGAVGALVATPALIVASAFVTRLTVLRHGGLEPLGASAPPDPNLP